MDLSLDTQDKRKEHLLLAASELYVTTPSHPRQEQRVFEELFRQLIPETPAPHRLTIARLLAPYGDAPLDCLTLLTFDPDAQVAAAAVSTPRALPEPDLINRAAGGPEIVRRAIAKRDSLSLHIVTTLFRHGDIETVRSVLQRDDIEIDDSMLDLLTARPELLAPLASDLARRKALPADTLFHLFLDLNTTGRMEAIAAAEARTLSELARKGDPRILSAQFKPAVLRSLVDAALSGGVAAFAAHLAYTLDLPGDVAARIVDDTGGEALVVCLRALGTSHTESGRILVRLLGARLPLDDVRALLRLQDTITPRAAMMIAQGWRKTAAAETPPRERTAAHTPLQEGVAHAERRAVGSPMQTGRGGHPLPRRTVRRDAG
ncbi:DUF2336 domain-containing protein [Stappia sp. ES.058]|uniref:DUF2336 domain-containing protein n=1 Tax=Stappia sp. ES.058 TaxID=1881061 RepID=UPI00087C2EDD|nr:DUF2336 domain-containing protein [Stappia sp. ES.058]SDT98689.1 Uncharacterized conserved protein, DUF2336 family [Stappia sp. ES.058]